MFRSGVSESPYPFAIVAFRGREGEVRADAVEAVLTRDAPGMTRVAAAPGVRLLGAAAATRVADGRWIIGEFEGAAPPAGPLERLVDAGWGRWVAVDLAPDPAVLRDPSGAIPVWILADEALTVAASTVTPALARASGIRLAVDDVALAHALAHPAATAHLDLLAGAQRLGAGEAACWSEGRLTRSSAWSPAAIAARARRRDGGEAEAELRQRSAEAVTVHARGARHLLLELSGGLDSSIVLGALAAGGAASRTTALNLASRQAAVDERRYARAAAARAGVVLREAWLDADTIDLTELETLAQPPEPLNFALDLAHNRVLAAEVEAAGADVVLTGQGGDAVFFQMATPLVGVDLVRLDGWRALAGRAGWAAAHRARCSLWTIAGLALRDRWRGTAPPAFPPALLTEAAAGAIEPARLRHPWTREAASLPPAKALQIDALANCQLFMGPTLGAGTARQRHPLLAQPLVELGLSLPAPQLADGPLDRALARRAFAAWLPQSVQQRRGKGEAAGHYNRAAVGNLAHLRRHLLDGYLVSRGLLDRHRLDELLDESALLWREDYRLLLATFSLELWARWWQAQLER